MPGHSFVIGKAKELLKGLSFDYKTVDYTAETVKSLTQFIPTISSLILPVMRMLFPVVVSLKAIFESMSRSEVILGKCILTDIQNDSSGATVNLGGIALS